ncbi:MAG: ADP-ribosylglycohydrolase family protein [Bacteroidia bacterium]|nr:ADP-ribosylglycohydrolase family protein [Bacteroidia bacterium]
MNSTKRTELARKSLWGVSMGDAFGESFFGVEKEIERHLRERTIPPTAWEFTDDTVMTIAVLEQLEQYGKIEREKLAVQFAQNHAKDPNRGYGATARRILRAIENGEDWELLSKSVFDGMGSMGNGGAMRASPIGAYFFDQPGEIEKQAVKSAEVTHYNLEGIAGAIAVARAAGLATETRIHQSQIDPLDFIQIVRDALPDSDTKSKINKSLSVPYSYSIETVKTILGNGINMTAQDTVPFCIWCAAYNLRDFESAIWKAVSALGDRDTICAIVGGITIMSTDESKIPADWIKSVEDFETSVFRTKG